MSNLNYNAFGNAKQISWKSFGKIYTNHTENMNWSVPANQLFLGHDWYIEKYELFNGIKNEDIIIDVGYKTGDWIGRISHFISPNIMKIGIDPIDNNVRDNLTFYYNCAIDDVEQPTEISFNLFDEPGCNSLLPKSEHLTSRNVINTITVSVRSLESVLLEKISLGTIIHYLKCDCQGKDGDVVKSLKSFAPYTKYVQIETSLDKNKPFYVNQPDYADDIISLRELGFEPIYWMEYLESPLPEGEIIFKNKNL